MPVLHHQYIVVNLRRLFLASREPEPFCRCVCVYVGRLGTNVGGSEPQTGRRAGQAEDEMGQGNGADQGDVPGGVGRGPARPGRGREREGPSRNQSRRARGTNRGTANKVRQHFVVSPLQSSLKDAAA